MEQVGIEIGNGQDNTTYVLTSGFIDNRKNIILKQENISLSFVTYHNGLKMEK